ncbi:hypothetical protein [Dickeya sp. ws52]|uniref:hypothetical protein n=1 Tax=Dickeya sp. ws52 TaxID=2576377 RepID=UPI00117C6364|nr:hypothetical protein [Dickeya sp. ws52]TYL41361.1 hypothetical protein FDP13_18510 [Dickeya sp. ws52]
MTSPDQVWHVAVNHIEVLLLPILMLMAAYDTKPLLSLRVFEIMVFPRRTIPAGGYADATHPRSSTLFCRLSATRAEKPAPGKNASFINTGMIDQYPHALE